MYKVWSLEYNEISTETLWVKWDEFCKPQANELRTTYDLLKSFSQPGSSVDEWYNQAHK